MSAAIEKISAALSNVEFLSEKVDDFMLILMEFMEQYDKTLLEPFQRTINMQKLVALKPIDPQESCLIKFFYEKKMESQLKILIKDTTTGLFADPKFSIDAIFTFLDEVMQQFNDSLTERNFKLIYDAIWAEIVALMCTIVKSYSSVSFIASRMRTGAHLFWRK